MFNHSCTAIQIYFLVHQTSFLGLGNRLVTYPYILCSFASPLPIVLFSGMYLLFLAIMRLMTVISIDSFMNLQHDVIVAKLDIAAVFIVSGITILELILGHGKFCTAPFATVLLETRIGPTAGLEIPFKTSGSGLPWYSILVALALLVYLISVLVENKEYLRNFSLDTVWNFIPKLSMRTSQINQDPEQGEELQSPPRTAGAKVSQSFGLDNLVSIPPNLNLTGPSETVGLARIIQVAAYRPSVSPQVLSVHEEVASQAGRNRQETMSQSEKSFPRLETFSYSGDQTASATEVSDSATVVPVSQEEIPQTDDGSNVVQRHTSREQPGESDPETAWRASFLIVILAFIGCLIFILADMKNGQAPFVIERIIILSYYCLPFYWVILVEECYLVSKRIIRTWLADYFSIYFD